MWNAQEQAYEPYHETPRLVGDARYDGSEYRVSLPPDTRSDTPIIDVLVPPGEQVDASFTLHNAANNTPPYVLRVETSAAAEGSSR